MSAALESNERELAEFEELNVSSLLSEEAENISVLQEQPVGHFIPPCLSPIEEADESKLELSLFMASSMKDFQESIEKESEGSK